MTCGSGLTSGLDTGLDVGREASTSLGSFDLFTIFANGHRSSLFLPGTVKSCSKTLVADVPRCDVLTMLSVVPEILLFSTSEGFRQPRREASLLDALRPSLIASAVCCLDPEGLREGSGTKVARSGELNFSSGGSWSFAIVADISGSDGAYLSARCWYCESRSVHGRDFVAKSVNEQE
jgi:hypothetical protein